MSQAKRQILPFFIPHAGCPHRCIFCEQRTISGQAQAPQPEQICAAVEAWHGKGELEVAFYGGSFTALDTELQKKYLSAVQPYLLNGKICGIRVSTRPDAVDEAGLALLRSYGVNTVELGVQSLDDAVLARAERGHSAQHSLTALRLLLSLGFTAGVQLMPGLPGDTYEKCIRGAAQILALRPHLLRIYPTLVIKGTPLADAYQSGAYEPLSLTDAVRICADIMLLAQYYGTKVIRVGLQNSPEISRDGAVLAGPYADAFGHLVQAEVWQRKLQYLRSMESGDTVYVAKNDLAALLGQNCSKAEFERRYAVHIVLAELPSGALGLGDAAGCRKLLTEAQFVEEFACVLLRKFDDGTDKICYTES